MPVSVTHSAAADSTFSAAGRAAWDAGHTVSGLGTMAEQAASAVAITGGTIVVTSAGATTYAIGTSNDLTLERLGANHGKIGNASTAYGDLSVRTFYSRDTSGVQKFRITTGALSVFSSGNVSWTNGTAASDTADTVVSRNSAGSVQIGTDPSTYNALGSLRCAQVILSSYAKLGSFTVATLPSASTAGAGSMVYCSDETGGAVPVFSDGTNWRRVTDRAIAA